MIPASFECESVERRVNRIIFRFWEGNDASEAPHHTRVEGISGNLAKRALTGRWSSEVKGYLLRLKYGGRVRIVANK